MATTDVKFRLLGDASSAVKAFGRAGDAGDKLGGRLKGLAGGALALGGVAGLGAVASSAFGLSKELTGLQAKSKTVFGDSLGDVTSWAKTVNKNFGLSRNEVVGLATNMADLLKPMGFTAAQAAAMSTETVGLAGALSEWSGGTLSAADASEVLSKAMLGERDGLKALGISISQAEVDQRAFARAQAEGRDEITEMDKALATQELIFEKSTDAQAAYAAGGNKLIRAQNTLTATFKDMRDWLVMKIIPAIGQAVDMGARMVAWARENKDILLAVGVALGIVAGAAGLIGLVNALKAARAAMFGLNAVMAVNPLILVAAAVAALVAGLIILYNRSDTFRKLVDKLWERLKVLGEAFAEVGKAIAEAVVRAFDIVRPILDAHLRTLKGIIDFIRAVFTGDWAAAWEAVKEIAAGVFDQIKALFGLFKDGLIALVKLAGDGLKAAGPVLWSWIIDGFKALPGAVRKLWTLFKTGLVAQIKAAGIVLKAAGPVLWSWITSGIAALPGLIRDAATGFADVLFEAGKDLVRGLINGIKSIGGEITSTLTSFIPGPVKGAFGGAAGLFGKITPFASGGVAEPNNPFLAMLGDNRREPEVISPVSTMRDAFAAELAARGGAGGGVFEVSLNIDGREFDRLVLDTNNRNARLSGVG